MFVFATVRLAPGNDLMDTDDIARRNPSKQTQRKSLFQGGNKYTIWPSGGKTFSLVENRSLQATKAFSFGYLEKIVLA